MNTTKKWVFKYKYLQLELDEVTSQQEEYTAIFMEDFKDTLMDESNHDGIDKASAEGQKLIDELNEEVKPKNNSKIAKELYRNISRKTHPDVIKDEKMNKIFSKAAKAYEDLNLMELVMLSDELDIDVEKEFDKKDLDTLEKNCKKVQTEIDTIKSSITWQWCSYPEEERMDLKEHFIDLLIRQ